MKPMISENNNLLGVPVGSGTLEEITSLSLQLIEKRDSPHTFVCANPHSIVVAQNDSMFMNVFRNADFVVADGVGVVLMGKIAHITVGPRIAGEDYFFSLLNRLNQKAAGRVFFFGSSELVLELIEERFTRDYPALTLCGTYSPPFGEWSKEANDEMVETINKASPDVLWVGMTAPKQEKWVESNRHELNVPIIGSIGAVFDFYAGTYPRAPQWMRNFGLEWLYRLASEPRRMWRRNFVSNPKFVLLIIWKHIIRRY